MSGSEGEVRGIGGSWSITCGKDDSMWTARVRHAGVPMCRLTVSDEDLTPKQAQAKLMAMAQAWIEEYRSRPQTDFGGLR